MTDPEELKPCPDTGNDYVERVCNAAPFADNEAGIPQMVELIKALRAERDEALANFECALEIASKSQDRSIDYSEKNDNLEAKLAVAVDALREIKSIGIGLHMSHEIQISEAQSIARKALSEINQPSASPR